jgi:hypothetical protein
MRIQWSVAIHSEGATMNKNRGKAFVVRIPKTAKPMEIQAFHNLKKLGYIVEAH